MYKGRQQPSFQARVLPTKISHSNYRKPRVKTSQKATKNKGVKKNKILHLKTPRNKSLPN